MSAPGSSLPPLVDAGGPLSIAEVERYSRHIRLETIDTVGQQRMKNARVLVVGAGGLGSPVLLYLAAAGIGTIGIIDDDTVDLSNLQRQIIHTTPNVGLPKVASAREAIRTINPDVCVIEHPYRLTESNALRIIDYYDLVVDGTDNFATRYLVSDATTILGKPSVWGALLQFGAQVSVFWSAHGPTYRDLYPDPPDPGSAPTCGEAGVLGMLCGIAGALMAAETIKVITGIGTALIGRVATYDALHAGWQEFLLAKDPATPRITTLGNYEAFCGADEAADERVSLVSADDLRSLLRRRHEDTIRFELIDVREHWEHVANPIPGSRPVPLGLLSQNPELVGIDRHALIVVFCHSGARSGRAARILARAGYTDVHGLAGGVAAWTAASHERTS